MRVGRTLAGVAGIAIVAGAALSFAANRTPYDAAQIAMLTDRLFEFGAVDFVHARYEGPHTALFACVAAGKTLTPAQSVIYRTAYQVVLLENQSLFARLDANLQLQRDAGMTQPNNADGKGIAGLHDHHDASAADNAREMGTHLTDLLEAGPLRRAWMANDIYKDLTDLMVHMAPATHSVGLLGHDAYERTGMDPAFSAYYAAMKRAQAAPVNSDAYWQAIDEALVGYAGMVESVQQIIRTFNGPVLHAFSGQWLAVQTVAPRLDAHSPSAAKRQRAQTPCLL